MKEIVKQYGRALLSAVMVAAVLLVLGISFQNNTLGFVDVIGKGLPSSTEASVVLANDSMKQAKEREVPKAFGREDLCVNKSYTTQELIRTEDADGREAKVRILEICDAYDEENLISQIKTQAAEVYVFEKPGIYRLKVFVWDEKGADNMGWLYLAVKG